MPPGSGGLHGPGPGEGNGELKRLIKKIFKDFQELVLLFVLVVVGRVGLGVVVRLVPEVVFFAGVMELAGEGDNFLQLAAVKPDAAAARTKVQQHAVARRFP